MSVPARAVFSVFNSPRDWDGSWQACPELAGFAFVEKEVLLTWRSSLTGDAMRMQRQICDTRIELPDGWHYRCAARLTTRNGRFERIVYQAVPKGGA